MARMATRLERRDSKHPPRPPRPSSERGARRAARIRHKGRRPHGAGRMRPARILIELRFEEPPVLSFDADTYEEQQRLLRALPPEQVALIDEARRLSGVPRA